MPILGKLFLLLSVLLAIADSECCPTWFFQSPNSTECVCGKHFKSNLKCDSYKKTVSIYKTHCMTYNNDQEYYGSCPYNTHSKWSKLPSNKTELNSFECGPLNRSGLLCSECEPGLGPAVFSYQRQCEECIQSPYGWILFTMRLVFPLTIYCIVLIVFKINIATAELNGYVFICQIIINKLIDMPFFFINHTNSYSIEKFGLDCLGLFYLNTFNLLIPSFCISENMGMVTVILLEYLIALYPIAFTATMYMLITLHGRGFKPIVNCWRPFKRYFSKIFGKWELKGSVVNAFATFILLSYCKFVSTSLYLLQNIKLIDKHNNISYGLYYDMSYDLTSWRYTVIQSLAIIVLVLIVFIPALFVLVYQIKPFQRLLHWMRIRCTLVHEVANILQACFKNGTTPGTRDYRWFAGLYLIVRVLLIFLSNQSYHTLINPVIGCAMVTLVAFLQPYRSQLGNYIDSLIWFSYTVLKIVVLYKDKFYYDGMIIWFEITVGVVLLIYIPIYILLKLLRRVKSSCKKKKALAMNVVSEDSLRVFPHRLEHPDEYQPLLKPMV